MILRHGKPAAAIVPVDFASPKPRRTPMSESAIQTLFNELARYDDPKSSAVADLEP